MFVLLGFLLLGACSLTLDAAFAQTSTVDELPKMPAGTVLFDAEARFARRGKLGGFAMKPSRYGVYYDQKEISIRYRKAPDPAFCGAYLIVLADLSRYATMTFWIKGEKGGETFELGMNDTISNKREDAVVVGSIHRYLPQGVTTEWQEVRIPLEDFFGADLSRVYSIVFNFNEEGEGRFRIDRVSFDTEPLVDREGEVARKGELLLDNFDHSDLNLLGRKTNAYKKLPSVCTFQRVSQPRRGDHGRSLRLDFDKQTSGWCGYYTLFNQIDGIYEDLTPYRNIHLWVRGAEGGETFEIGFADKSWLTIGDSVKAGTIEKYLPDRQAGLPGGVTTQWQEVVIPLADFGKLDWTQMGSFVINFHKPGKGTVFLDDLRLVRKTGEELLKEWDQ